MPATPFTVAPIGTCRIHTPLRLGAGRYPIRPLLARNYGFVHTTSEAIQQLGFMSGETTIPADVRRLTFRPGVPANFDGKAISRADLYVVEVSSRKLLTVGDHPIQINYMGRHFEDFFSDRQRTRQFWSMAVPNRLEERRRVLDQDPAFLRLSPEDRDLLARIQRRDLTDEEIALGMRQIAEKVGKDKIVFVTHVDAETPDNMHLEPRRRLINAVRGMARDLGVPCYDPTPLMRRLGQANAMENGGLDLAHYTDVFAGQLCEDWYTHFVVPRLDEAAGALARNEEAAPPVDMAGSIESDWDAGHWPEASRRLHEVLRKGEAGKEYRVLLGRMRYELGDFEGAIEQLDGVRCDADPDEKVSLMLMRCCFETADYERAGLLAAALMADEMETPEILRICAISSEKSGDAEMALVIWKRLFRNSPDDVEAATAVGRLLAAMNDRNGATRWAQDVRQAQPDHLPSFEFLWNRKLEDDDRLGLLELAREPVRFDEAAIFALARQAADRGCAIPAALLVVEQGVTRSEKREVADWIAHQATRWLLEGTAALDSGDLLRACDGIQARALINPNGKELIRVRRSLERLVRQSAHGALMAKDYQRAADVLAIARQTLVVFPEYDSFRVRVAEALGDVEAVLPYLHGTAESGDLFSDVEWIKLGRLAVRGGHYGEAINAYARVFSSGSSEETLRSEARRQILGLRSRTIRHARGSIDAGNYEQAWVLLGRLQKFDPDSKDVAAEKKRVLGVLHARVKSLDSASDADRLSLGETILRLVPDDPVGLKAAATGAMRVHRFEDSLRYWQALRGRSSSPSLIDVNIQKCRMWIDRANRRKAA